MSRIVSFFVFFGLTLLDWLLNYFQPQQNAGNWLAAAFGAFVIRFALPKIPLFSSFWGWLVAFIIACLFAPEFVQNGGIWGLKRPETIYGIVALVGDLIIQFLAWVIRIAQGVGKYAEANPGAAFDEGLERVEKVTNVWVRIKAPFLDLLTTFKDLTGKKP